MALACARPLTPRLVLARASRAACDDMTNKMWPELPARVRKAYLARASRILNYMRGCGYEIAPIRVVKVRRRRTR